MKYSPLMIPGWLREQGEYELKQRPYGHWLNSHKQYYWATVLQRGLRPTSFPKQERWKHTNLSFLEEPFIFATNGGHKEVPSGFIDQWDQIRAHDGSNAMDPMLVFVNGQFRPELSDSLYLFSNFGVIVQSLSQLSLEQVSQATRCWPAQDQLDDYPMAHLNSALFNEGLFLSIPPHAQITTPIRLISIIVLTADQSTQLTRAPMWPLQHRVYVGEGASTVLLEEYIAIDLRPSFSADRNTYFMNAVVSLLVEKEATLHYYKLQNGPVSAVHFGHTFIQQQAQSTVYYWAISSGGLIAREDLLVLLQDRQASFKARGIYTAKHNQQIMEHHLSIRHQAAYTQSEILYKGILDQQSCAVFTSEVCIPQAITAVSAKQTNHNILLSTQATIYTSPKLMIYSDAVCCKHGATVGQLDLQALFYLCSRGIDQEKAVKMLLDGFVNDILHTIGPNHIKEQVMAIL